MSAAIVESPKATVYTDLELANRKLATRRIFHHDISFNEDIRLPWSELPAREVLSHDYMQRLLGAMAQVFDIGIGKAILLQETNYLWLVHVAEQPNHGGYRITWRFVCEE